MQWTGGHKASTLTAQRVFNRGGLEELRSETMKARAALPPHQGVRPAGAPSGATDRDIGRMAALNCSGHTKKGGVVGSGRKWSDQGGITLQIFAVFITRKHRLCIVMDYADGGDGQLLDEAQILEWFVQTCFALKHVHDRKVLHRDLKTQNIFLMSNGCVKLGDFGIARVLEFTKDYARTMVGTPYYLSPEIIKDRPYNFTSDVWSLGVVLYEMSTLKHPFDADSLVLLASKILKDQYPPPDSSYSPELLSLIKAMLCKDAHMRPVVNKILCYGFLQETMEKANKAYHLGLDLSEFAKAAAETVMREKQAPSPSGATGLHRDTEMLDEHSEMQSASGFREPDVGVATASLPGRPTTASPEKEEEYEEEFEDYSGSEAGDEKPPSELRTSVANLKIGNSKSIEALGFDGCPRASWPEADTGAVTEDRVASVAEKAASYAHKADALRAYLRGQMPEDEYRKVHALVCASGEVSPEELQRRVCSVLGAEKAPDLLTLFQLLCFLENVSAGIGGHTPTTT
eukprot:s111_g15.t1